MPQCIIVFITLAASIAESGNATVWYLSVCLSCARANTLAERVGCALPYEQRQAPRVDESIIQRVHADTASAHVTALLYEGRVGWHTYYRFSLWVRSSLNELETLTNTLRQVRRHVTYLAHAWSCCEVTWCGWKMADGMALVGRWWCVAVEVAVGGRTVVDGDWR